MSPGSHERRKFTRIEARKNDVYHPKYKCLDISESGLKLETSKMLEIGHMVEVEFRALAEPIKVNCKVMWCNKSASIFDECFHAGVEFANLPRASRALLREFIESRS